VKRKGPSCCCPCLSLIRCPLLSLPSQPRHCSRSQLSQCLTQFRISQTSQSSKIWGKGPICQIETNQEQKLPLTSNIASKRRCAQTPAAPSSVRHHQHPGHAFTLKPAPGHPGKKTGRGQVTLCERVQGRGPQVAHTHSKAPLPSNPRWGGGGASLWDIRVKCFHSIG
jgi:hypothetical protein